MLYNKIKKRNNFFVQNELSVPFIISIEYYFTKMVQLFWIPCYVQVIIATWYKFFKIYGDTKLKIFLLKLIAFIVPLMSIKHYFTKMVLIFEVPHLVQVQMMIVLRYNLLISTHTKTQNVFFFLWIPYLVLVMIAT